MDRDQARWQSKPALKLTAEDIARANELCRKLPEIRGVDLMTSTASDAHIDDANCYKNGTE